MIDAETPSTQEYSTLKKVKNLSIALIVYGLIFIIVQFTLIHFQVSAETIATTTFFFVVYAITILAIATVELSGKLSLQAFQILLYISIGIILSGILSLIASYFYNMSLSNINGWSSVIGGAYLLFFWTICHGGLGRK